MTTACIARKLSPVLIVDDIAPALSFWRDRLGFQVTAEIPLADDPTRIGFAILVNGPVEVMLQTVAAVAQDIPALAAKPFHASLFLEVVDVATVERSLHGCEIVLPRRKTFYGADEVGVRAPGGHVVVFAQMTE